MKRIELGRRPISSYPIDRDRIIITTLLVDKENERFYITETEEGRGLVPQDAITLSMELFDSLMSAVINELNQKENSHV